MVNKLKNLWKERKKPILIALAVVLALGIGGGVWYYLGHNSAEPVYVFPFNYVGMTEYWGDSQESYGPVTTDKIQTVFLSEDPFRPNPSDIPQTLPKAGIPRHIERSCFQPLR